MFETSISIRQKKQGHSAPVASVLLHCALAIILFTITVPETLQTAFRATPIYLPPAALTAPRRHITQPFKHLTTPKLAPKLSLPAPSPQPAKVALALPEAPAIHLPPAAPATLNLPQVSAAVPPPVVLTPVVPTPILPRKPEIHTGGFESSVTPAPRATDTPVKAHSSGFDSANVQPAKNARAAVVTGGAFGDGTDTLGARAPHREIASTQFDAIAASPSRRSNQPASTVGLQSALEITFKPRPLYTDEARRLRIEGDVVLQVMFRASSEVCVLHVLRGLGHGLDENAISAAAGIRFRPATQAGRPIDDIATVRINFQLAD
jgi:protein TonB